MNVRNRPLIRMSMSRIPHRRLLALSLLAALAGSCNTVEFYEREALADRAMMEGDDEAETHFLQKVRYSDEGAAGGIGSGAGGGCGCY